MDIGGIHIKIQLNVPDDTTRYVKVEPYPIPGSFLKLKYLKTELNVDNGTDAIV